MRAVPNGSRLVSSGLYNDVYVETLWRGYKNAVFYRVKYSACMLI